MHVSKDLHDLEIVLLQIGAYGAPWVPIKHFKRKTINLFANKTSKKKQIGVRLVGTAPTVGTATSSFRMSEVFIGKSRFYFY